MKRSINFGSIFRRKDGLPDSKEQSGKEIVLERLADRAVILKEGDLVPFTTDAPPLEWTKVGGHITIPASAIEGLMEGRGRIRAEQLKKLEPSPIQSGADDAFEYEVVLAAIVPQIVDLFDPVESGVVGQPEFETPFSVLAREDDAKLAHTNRRKRQDAQPKPEVPPNGVESKPPAAQDSPGASRPSLSLSALRALSRPSAGQLALPAESAANEPVASGEPETRAKASASDEQVVSKDDPRPAQREVIAGNGAQSVAEPAPEPDSVRSDGDQREPLTARPDDLVAIIRESAPAQRDEPPPIPPLQRPLDEDRARLGVEALQEIFMTSKPLDGRKVASLVREWPGVTGVLILMEGGVVLGGQLPECLSLEAALQAPTVLKSLTRFISEVEHGRKADTRIVTVTSVTTISLVASGQVVLLVSHENRKLPPGLSVRLAHTAEALDQIYGNED